MQDRTFKFTLTRDGVVRTLLGGAAAGLIVLSFFQGRGNFAAAVLFGGIALLIVATRHVTALEVSATGARAELDGGGAATSALASRSEMGGTDGLDADQGDAGVASARLALARRVMSDLLLTDKDQGPLAGCGFHLFLYDAEVERLLPALEPAATLPSQGWNAGQGATGEAFRRGEYVLVTSADVHNGTYGLTIEQQERYRHLALVAAMPVKTASGRTIGVLSASTDDCSSAAGSPEGFDEHLELAVFSARVLVDLLHWYED